MLPFGEVLTKIVKSRGFRHQDLAAKLGLHPTYLSALMHGRKGQPGALLLEKIKEALDLTDAELSQVSEAARLSFRQLELPISSSADERIVVEKLVSSMGRLLPEQLQAITSILLLTPSPQGRMTSERRQ